MRPTSNETADDGIRTRDLRFTKPLLYQLSYVGAPSGEDGIARRLRQAPLQRKHESLANLVQGDSLGLVGPRGFEAACAQVVQAGRSCALGPNNRFNAAPNVRPLFAFPARATNTGQTARFTMLRVRSPIM